MSFLIRDINRKYIPAAKTNILDTLKRFGFEPPSEDVRYLEKWQTYRHLAQINEGDAK